MRSEEPAWSLNELSALSGVNPRTVRFYIQKGLVDRPEGTRKAATYNRRHLQQLLSIERWKRSGLTLEGIRAALARSQEHQTMAPPPAQVGEVRVWSHIHLGPGVALHIDPQAAGLGPEQVRELARQVAAAFLSLNNKENNDVR